MSNNDLTKVLTVVPTSEEPSGTGSVKDIVQHDDRDIMEMGYVVEHQDRNFNVLNIFAIGYSICNSAIAIIVALATGLASGGPVLYVYMQLLVYLMSLCVAISLAELASALPNAGGQYYWASQLAPKRMRSTISFIVGIVGWVSSVFTAASVALVIPQMAIGMLILVNPDMVSKPWMVFIGYQATNFFVFGFNCFNRILPLISQFVLTISLSTVVIIFVSLLAAAPSYQPASFVFATLVNESGWGSSGIALLTGMVGINWGFSCLDAVTHLAEEIPNPRRNIPKALIGTVVVGIVTSFPMALAILFCLQDIDAIIATPTLVPSIELFNQVFRGNHSAVIGMQCLILISNVGSFWGVHSWQARLAWSFARDHGLPFSKWIGHVSPPPFDVPLYAHAWSTFWVAVLGCLYLGSSVAFNSFVGGAIIMQYLTYSICIVLLLIHGRKNFNHGPFWLERIGPVANYATIAWTIVVTTFYCFPPYLPVQVHNMNYVSVVIVGIFSIVALWYVLGAKRRYTTPIKME